MDTMGAMRRVYDAINAGDDATMLAAIADDFVEHEEMPPGIPTTREGVVQWFGVMRAAFPDLRFEVEELLPSGDRVVARVRVTGTHQGEFMGMPPTGRTFAANVIDIIRFDDDGLAAEHWGVFDAMAMMQQLGAVE